MKEIVYCIAEHPTLQFMGIRGPQALGISRTFLLQLIMLHSIKKVTMLQP